MFLDRNHDGIRQVMDPEQFVFDEEVGIGGVTVTLTGTTASGQDVNLTDVTDSKGRYEFP